VGLVLAPAALASAPLTAITRGGAPLTQSPAPGYRVLAAAVIQQTVTLPLIGAVTTETNALLLRSSQGIEIWNFNTEWQFVEVGSRHNFGTPAILQAEIDFGIDLSGDRIVQEFL